MEAQINRLKAQIEMIQGKFNKDLEKLKNKQSTMNNAITETENTLKGANHRVPEAEQNKEKRKSNEDSLRDLWDNIKCPNIQIIGVPEEEDKRKGHGKIFEDIIVKNFPDKGKETATQIQEARRVHENRNQKKIGVAILISDKKQTLK